MQVAFETRQNGQFRRCDPHTKAQIREVTLTPYHDKRELKFSLHI
jgi:hypothetical protein